jgi:hypothetical protein
MGGSHKRSAQVDNGDGTYSVAGICFVKYGKRIKIYLGIPASSKVGCHCSNLELWENIIEKLLHRQKELVLSKETTHAYYGDLWELSYFGNRLTIL